MVSNIATKCGMQTFVGVTRLAYTDSDNLYIAGLTTYLESIAGLDPPATVYAYDDISVSNEGNFEENSNIGDNASAGDDIQNCKEDEDKDKQDGDDDPDNYVYEIPDLDLDEARRNEAYVVRSFLGNDDFHNLPPLLRSDDPVITPTHAIQ
ncbi:hypothetical protein OSB04_025018 [Centaurea solstitialis]|uniref:Uncharacterized protein n=1 Tax=Centaurea solstitialis TaxID=347529 RepID=A0AA38T0N2_9ASTR|nr:hypothetical protein OSB04_025018 [Centaurea solstitialis]